MTGTDLRAAAARHDARLLRRLDRLVPILMRRAGLDAWVVAAREYAEDPVLATMLPATWLATARRRTILLFLVDGDAVTRRAIARYPVGDAFPGGWDPDADPDQWAYLARVLDAADPQRIGIDRSAVFPLADGLTASEHDAMVAVLPDRLRGRLVSAQDAAVGWLETRLPEERADLARACATTHGYLRTALSSQVVTPGTTSTEDVEWWLRETVRAAGYGSWFHPSCSVQRQDADDAGAVPGHGGPQVIRPGDLVHVDFGIVAEGLCTDQQQMAYVLRPGQTAAPAGLAAGIARANAVQDLVTAAFRTGRTGNEVLALALDAAHRGGIDARVYSHPIGLHGHAAGPTIGLWDRQDGVPGQGDHPLRPDTAYSIELQARVAVPEWGGRTVAFMLEEDAYFDGQACTFLDGRQTQLWLIG